MANVTITIDCQDDGSYAVTIQDKNPQGEGESPDEVAEEAQPQTVQSVDDVVKIVQDELGEYAKGGAKAAWDQEAAQRDATGQRTGPAMSM